MSESSDFTFVEMEELWVSLRRWELKEIWVGNKQTKIGRFDNDWTLDVAEYRGVAHWRERHVRKNNWVQETPGFKDGKMIHLYFSFYFCCCDKTSLQKRTQWRKELFGLQVQVVACHFEKVKVKTEAASHMASAVKLRISPSVLACLFALSWLSSLLHSS